MARRGFRQVHIGLEANPFDVGDALGSEVVVEILGDEVRLDASAGTIGLGSGQSPLAHDLANAIDELRRRRRRSDLLAEFFRLGRRQNIVEIREQCSQGQPHGRNSDT